MKYFGTYQPITSSEKALNMEDYVFLFLFTSDSQEPKTSALVRLITYTIKENNVNIKFVTRGKIVQGIA